MTNKVYFLVIGFMLVLFLVEMFLEYLLGRTVKVRLYEFNGITIDERKLAMQVPSVAGTDECSTLTMVTCNVADQVFGCSNCKELLSQCVHFDSDLDGIPANRPGEGYCLPLSNDRNKRKCSEKNGGKWVLVENEGNSYSFVCVCNKESFFTKDGPFSDCVQFAGCRNGKIEPGWKTFDEIRCKCDENFEMVVGTQDFPPQCRRKNIFRREKDLIFEPIDKSFVSPRYLELVASDVRLPNPCHFDVATRKFDSSIGKLVLDPVTNIAYCEALNKDYIEITTTDDYLLNNQGKYSNGVCRIVQEGRKSIAYEDNVVYEVHRKHKSLPDEPLEGRRLLYSDFLFQLPYFNPVSRNMGNFSGKLYDYLPIADHRYNDTPKVTVFRARKPVPIKFRLSNFLSWMPAFNTTSYESAHRIFNGVVAVKNMSLLPDKEFHVLYPVPPGKCVKYLLKTEGLIDNLYRPDLYNSQFTRYYAMPLFSQNNQINPYNSLFTGLIMTYKHNDKFYSKPLSPGNLVICNKYRRHYDSDWRNFPEGKPRYVVNDCPQVLSLANDTEAHLFTENAFNFERDEIGCPSKYAGKYRIKQDGTVEFADMY